MHPSSVEPFNPDPSALHPMLQKALDNLDVQLEDELTRYRQQRYRQLGRTGAQDLIKAPRRNSEVMQAPIMPPLPDYAPDYTTLQPLDSDVWETEDSNHPPQSNLSTFDARRVVREMRAVPQVPPGSPHSAFPIISQQPKRTDDYFASSEELLNSFPHPEAKAGDRQSTLLDTLLTPLGVGSMLLLLLSSISLGYVILYPSSLGFLAALGRGDSKDLAATTSPNDNQSLSPNLASDEFIDVNLNTLSQLPKNDRPSTVVTVPQTATPTLPTGSRSTQRSSATTDAPRLSAAVTAPPLQTITIPSRPVIRQSEPLSTSPAVRESAPTRESAPVRESAPAYMPPASEPYVAPAPQPAAIPASRPAPESAPVYASPAAPAPIAQAPAPANRYYVVTEYTGDPSLSQARQAIGDAYVRNFDDGAKVQMGSFGDSASAEQMVQQLQQQGVPAQVYQP